MITAIPDPNTLAVLYVDDEEQALKYFRRGLEKDFRILTAPGVAQAIAILEQESDHVAVVISDQRMPGKSGVAMLSEIRERWPAIVRILVTAYTDIDSAVAAVNAGAVYKYINKPADFPTLRLTLKDAVNLHRETRYRDELARTVAALEEQRRATEVAEAQREQLQQRLIAASREAGRAEVATGILHNVGNVLNSMNVSASVVADTVQNSRVGNLCKGLAMLEEHASDLGSFLTTDERGQRLPSYLAKLSGVLTDEQTAISNAMGSLKRSIDHITQVIRGQQSYAKEIVLLQEVSPSELIEEALRVAQPAIDEHGVKVTREYAKVSAMLLDQHKVLQILINLVNNAANALKECPSPEKCLLLRISQADVDGSGKILYEVIDNGVGIAPESITRMFTYGFTTRKEGHGFGLHSAANAAREMGGSLTASSDGPGRGATFKLELPTTCREHAAANVDQSKTEAASMNSELLNQPRRVLVIDDNEWIHDDFRTILTAPTTNVGLADDEEALFGGTRRAAPQPTFQIDCALQGEEGYGKVKAAVAADNPYHLAFVDMRMPPGWDGVQTIQKLWDADPHLHVVICSAYSAYSWKEIADKLGATDRLLILKKPFDELEVFQIANSQSAKWLVTRQARLQMSNLEQLVDARTAELKQSALVDRLTGLPNRDLLNDRLSQLMQAARRDPQRKFAVLFLDFDRFKVINDSLGHEVGDLLIKKIADRLREETRRTDTVANLATTARLGGDEFVVVLDQLADYVDAIRVTERLMQKLAESYDIRGHVVHSTASIGITTNAIAYANPDEMIRDADIAMYRAKASGKACYMQFDRQMHDVAVRRLTLENDMREAIARRQFILHYQPIVSLATGATTGFEALVRWQHPERGLIPPLEFIPIAEEIGMIVPLGHWVLDEACRQLAEWRKEFPQFADMVMSVNLSRKQLGVPKLVGAILDVMKTHGIRPSDINLEITESAIMDDPEASVRVLHEIRQADVELHMDDFGSGYSSLSCLHSFPIGGLKIDRSFVKNMSERHDYALVIDAIISLAHKLNLRLVAEGVETVDQLTLLQGMGCKLGQGYYFAKPMPAAAAAAHVISQSKPKLPPPQATAA